MQILAFPAGNLRIKPISAEITGNVKSLFGVSLFFKFRLGKNIAECSPDSTHGKQPRWDALLTLRRQNESAANAEVWQSNTLLGSSKVGEAYVDLTEVFQKLSCNYKMQLHSEGHVVGTVSFFLAFEPDPPQVIVIPQKTQLQNQGQGIFPQQKQAIVQINTLPYMIPQQQVIQQQYQPNIQQQIQLVQPQQSQPIYAPQVQHIPSKDISEKDDPSMKEEEKCVICLENKRAGVFYKCGHNCCCNGCGVKFIGKSCPVCRQEVYDFVKVFN